MDSGDNYISTPVNKTCKKLGLRRTKFKNDINDSPAAKLLSTPASGKQRIFETLTPDCVHHVNTPSTTPVEGTTVRRISASTGQYKLSLNRRVRDRFRKKRLNFLNSSPIAASTEYKENVSNNIPENRPTPGNMKKCFNSGHTGFSLEESYSNAAPDPGSERKIRSIVDEAEVEQLEDLIRIWKKAFTEAIADLSAKSNTSEEELLDKLQISAEMIQCLNHSK